MSGWELRKAAKEGRVSDLQALLAQEGGERYLNEGDGVSVPSSLGILVVVLVVFLLLFSFVLSLLYVSLSLSCYCSWYLLCGCLVFLSLPHCG